MSLVLSFKANAKIEGSLTNKPENPFQNYDLAKKLLEAQKKFFCIKIFWYNHQKYKNRKPDPRPGKIYVQINQYVKRNLPT